MDAFSETIESLSDDGGRRYVVVKMDPCDDSNFTAHGPYASRDAAWTVARAAYEADGGDNDYNVALMQPPLTP